MLEPYMQMRITLERRQDRASFACCMARCIRGGGTNKRSAGRQEMIWSYMGAFVALS